MKKIKQHPLTILWVIILAAFLGLYGYVFAARSFAVPTFETVSGDPSVLDGVTLHLTVQDDVERTDYTIENGELTRRTDWGEHRDWEMAFQTGTTPEWKAFTKWTHNKPGFFQDRMHEKWDGLIAETVVTEDGRLFLLWNTPLTKEEWTDGPCEYRLFVWDDPEQETMPEPSDLFAAQDVYFHSFEVLPDGGLLFQVADKEIENRTRTLRYYGPDGVLRGTQKLAAGETIQDGWAAEPYRLTVHGDGENIVTLYELTDSSVERRSTWTFPAKDDHALTFYYLDGRLYRLYDTRKDTLWLEVYDETGEQMYQGAVKNWPGGQDRVMDQMMKADAQRRFGPDEERARQGYLMIRRNVTASVTEREAQTFTVTKQEATR